MKDLKLNDVFKVDDIPNNIYEAYSEPWLNDDNIWTIDCDVKEII
jgi:hypothetical protein